MESARFDQFARRIGRRGFLAAVTATVGGVIAARRTQAQAGEECGPEGCTQTCVSDADCGMEPDSCMGASCVDGHCAIFVVDCAPGYSCCGNASCCPNSCTTDEQCVTPLLCTTGWCGESGVCEFSQQEPCVICEHAGECLTTDGTPDCCSSVCVAACADGEFRGEDCVCRGEESRPPVGPPGWPPAAPGEWPAWPGPNGN